MEVRVAVEGWEHACCGRAVELNDIVTYTLFAATADVRIGAPFWEGHHDEPSGAGMPLTGRACRIEHVGANGKEREITRLPNGPELMSGALLIDHATGESFEDSTESFVVTLSVADGASLPTYR